MFNCRAPIPMHVSKMLYAILSCTSQLPSKWSQLLAPVKPLLCTGSAASCGIGTPVAATVLSQPTLLQYSRKTWHSACSHLKMAVPAPSRHIHDVLAPGDWSTDPTSF